MRAPLLTPVLVLLAVVLGAAAPARVATARPTAAQTRTLAACEEALATWQLGDARRLCARALLEQPQSARVRLAAAETLHQMGRFVTAAKMLDSLSPTNGADAASMPSEPLGAGGQAHFEFVAPRIRAANDITAGMQTHQSAHFVQWYADKDRIVAHYAAPILERAYDALVRELQFAPADDGERIQVVWQPLPTALARSTGLSAANIETSGTIAVCKFHQLLVLSPSATSGGYDWADTVAHELVHLFVAKKTRDNTPVWLHEGLAKFFQSSWRGAPGQALDRAAIDELKDAAKKGELISFARMHPSMAKLPSQKAAALAFTEVTTLIADLHRRLGRGAIERLLAALGRDVPLEAALRTHAKSDLAGLFERLKTLARAESQLAPLIAAHAFDEKPIALGAAAQEAPGEEQAPLLGPIADDTITKAARIAELLELRGHSAQAIPYLARASERAAQRYVALDVRLARLLRTHQAPERAAALMRKSEARHPFASEVKLELGLALAMLEKWPEAAEKLVESMQQNPFIKRAHEALARSYAALGRAEDAAREEEFAQMCARPRKETTPAHEGPGDAHLHVLSDDWGPRLLDGVQIATPAWQLPVAAGRHTLSSLRDEKSAMIADVTTTVQPGQTGWLIEALRP